MAPEPDLQRHLRQLTVLHAVITDVASALDPAGVVTSVLGSLSQLVDYQLAVVYLLDLDVAVRPDGPHRVLPTATIPRVRESRAADPAATLPRAGMPPASGSAVLEAIRGQRTISRPTSDGELELVVPFQAGGRAIGALDLRVAHALPEEDVRIIELLAQNAAVALQNAHLYQETQRLAITDPLTGLSNYRHFHDVLALEVQRARRMGYPLGLVLIDLDHFKRVNDRHGHPIGDEALRLVADVLRTRLRRTDVLGRLGGEEFGVILPGTSVDEVGVVAEKIRRAVDELPPLQGGMSAAITRVTVSVGGASLSDGVVDAASLVSCADQALYQAKHGGRNQVRLWTGQSDQTSAGR